MTADSTFWSSLAKIRVFVRKNPALLPKLQSDPASFLRENLLDATLSMGDGKSTTLSKILDDAGPAERGAILNSLFSFTISQRKLRSVQNTGGGMTTFDVEDDDGDDDPGETVEGTTEGVEGTGGDLSGDAADVAVGVLAIVNVNTFMNVNVIENANANSNANANQLTNTNANQYTNANANNNTNGLTTIGQALEITTNADLNNRTLELPTNFANTALSDELRKLGLSLPRQVALMKRAIVLEHSASVVNGLEEIEFSATYTYRKIAFSVVGILTPSKLVVTNANLISKNIE